MKRKLYLVKNGIGSYYVVATDPTAAENAVIDAYKRIGFDTSFQSPSASHIEVIAEEMLDRYAPTNKSLIL